MSERIRKSLDRALSNAIELEEELENLHLVIFSDHHRGGKDAADDFEQCERIYQMALEHYYYHEEKYRLVLLGDVEELWERKPEKVMQSYQPIMQAEARFYADGRYLRFVGNHDDNWYYPSEISRYFGDDYRDLAVNEAVRITVSDNGNTLGSLLFLHGHQGTLFSDQLGWLSRWVVRYIWRPLQRIFNSKSTTPSNDWQLRSKHDRAMYNWAVQQRDLVLIAGHTHRTVFIPGEQMEHQRKEVQMLQAQSGESATEEEVRSKQAFLAAAEQPCYFNTGCCSYMDGTITGIEISYGEIRLVRWPYHDGSHRPEVLATASLREVFRQVNSIGAQMSP